MKFTKMHGCGNDYVYVNCMEEKIEDRSALAKFVSNRNFAIGSDGLICIDPSDIADFKMDMYNADGSSSLMCGNGIRCVGKYVYDKGLTDKTTLKIETGAGIKTLELTVAKGTVESVRVNMGEPELRPKYIPVAEKGKDFIRRLILVGDKEFEVSAIGVGNAHCVVFVDDPDAINVNKYGPMFEAHPLFPEEINTEFVQVIDRNTLKMRVWERGSGETLACGTGATASLVAAAICGHTDDSVTVELKGGKLFIEWDRKSNQLYMTGPAVTVYDGLLCGTCPP